MLNCSTNKGVDKLKPIPIGRDDECIVISLWTLLGICAYIPNFTYINPKRIALELVATQNLVNILLLVQESPQIQH